MAQTMEKPSTDRTSGPGPRVTFILRDMNGLTLGGCTTARTGGEPIRCEVPPARVDWRYGLWVGPTDPSGNVTVVVTVDTMREVD